MTVRGAFGEGSAASGSFYQISNQITLGVSEQDIINRLTKTVGTVMEYERNTRKGMYRNLGVLLEDKIFRAIGVLKNARRMGYMEAQKLISDVALGASLGIVRRPSEQRTLRCNDGFKASHNRRAKYRHECAAEGYKTC